MARALRVEYEGAVYHVTARGNERRRIYRGEEDRKLFVETLEQMLERFGVVLHCFCLMPNHFHLVVETPLGNLCQGMAWLQSTYSVRFNRRYRRSGHLFQGRYKAHLVEADEYAMELVRYIHLNPVRPKNKIDPVPVEKQDAFEAYGWSSHQDYLGKRGEGLVKVSVDWLSFWGGKRGEARREYRKFMRAAFGREVETPWRNLKGGLVLGSEELFEKAKELIGGSEGKDEVQWISRMAGDAAKGRISKLVGSEKDERIKIWIRVELGGERMTAVARDLGYSDGSGVHRVVQRLNKRGEEDKKLRVRLTQLRSAAMPE